MTKQQFVRGALFTQTLAGGSIPKTLREIVRLASPMLAGRWHSNSLIPAAIVSDSSMSVDILSGVQWSSS